jgi:putative hydrolase of the HAD superfamily
MATQTTAKPRSNLTLFIDADDTLWENNVYFERVIDDFVVFLEHSTLDNAQVRAALLEVERANVKLHGYGARSFVQSLQDAYTNLSERDISTDDINVILSFGERILSHPMELIHGVQETLEVLATRHTLVLFTKGHEDDQRLKIDASGLLPYFTHTRITGEKDTASYHELVSLTAAVPQRTWMIGNSPKSDIHPALEAGLNAVLIPHEHTWQMEHADVEHETERLLVLQRFAQLLDHF